MPGRKVNTGNYHFGFNGMEKNHEIEGGNYDFGARMYDSRVGRWWSVDRMESTFVSESAYSFGGNSPIVMVDIGGDFRWPKGKEAEYEKKYPVLTAYLKSGDLTRLVNHKKVQGALTKYTNNELTVAQILKDSKYGEGPVLNIEQLDDACGKDCTGKYMGTYDETAINDLFIDVDLVNNLENALSINKRRDANSYLLGVVSTILHEYTHYGDRNNDYYEIDENGVFGDEEGILLEFAIWGFNMYNDDMLFDQYDQIKGNSLFGQKKAPSVLPIHPIIPKEVKPINNVMSLKINKINADGNAEVQKTK